jgi:hypothetical protein
MARQFSTPFQTYSAGTYGPYTVDGGQIGDRGAVLNFQRGASGTWPLTSSDVVLSVLVEGDHGGWHPLASATFVGGTMIEKGGATRTHDHLAVLWPQEIFGGVLVPVRPDRVRATLVLSVDLPTAASVEWLS